MDQDNEIKEETYHENVDLFSNGDGYEEEEEDSSEAGLREARNLFQDQALDDDSDDSDDEDDYDEENETDREFIASSVEESEHEDVPLPSRVHRRSLTTERHRTAPRRRRVAVEPEPEPEEPEDELEFSERDEDLENETLLRQQLLATEHWISVLAENMQSLMRERQTVTETETIDIQKEAPEAPLLPTLDGPELLDVVSLGPLCQGVERLFDMAAHQIVASTMMPLLGRALVIQQTQVSMITYGEMIGLDGPDFLPILTRHLRDPALVLLMAASVGILPISEVLSERPYIMFENTPLDSLFASDLPLWTALLDGAWNEDLAISEAEFQTLLTLSQSHPGMVQAFNADLQRVESAVRTVLHLLCSTDPEVPSLSVAAILANHRFDTDPIPDHSVFAIRDALASWLLVVRRMGVFLEEAQSYCDRCLDLFGEQGYHRCGLVRELMSKVEGTLLSPTPELAITDYEEFLRVEQASLSTELNCGADQRFITLDLTQILYGHGKLPQDAPQHVREEFDQTPVQLDYILSRPFYSAIEETRQFQDLLQLNLQTAARMGQANEAKARQDARDRVLQNMAVREASRIVSHADYRGFMRALLLETCTVTVESDSREIDVENVQGTAAYLAPVKHILDKPMVLMLPQFAPAGQELHWALILDGERRGLLHAHIQPQAHYGEVILNWCRDALLQNFTEVTAPYRERFPELYCEDSPNLTHLNLFLSAVSEKIYALSADIVERDARTLLAASVAPALVADLSRAWMRAVNCAPLLPQFLRQPEELEPLWQRLRVDRMTPVLATRVLPERRELHYLLPPTPSSKQMEPDGDVEVMTANMGLGFDSESEADAAEPVARATTETPETALRRRFIDVAASRGRVVGVCPGDRDRPTTFVAIDYLGSVRDVIHVPRLTDAALRFRPRDGESSRPLFPDVERNYAQIAAWLCAIQPATIVVATTSLEARYIYEMLVALLDDFAASPAAGTTRDVGDAILGKPATRRSAAFRRVFNAAFGDFRNRFNQAADKNSREEFISIAELSDSPEAERAERTADYLALATPLPWYASAVEVTFIPDNIPQQYALSGMLAADPMQTRGSHNFAQDPMHEYIAIALGAARLARRPMWMAATLASDEHALSVWCRSELGDRDALVQQIQPSQLASGMRRELSTVMLSGGIDINGVVHAHWAAPVLAYLPGMSAAMRDAVLASDFLTRQRYDTSLAVTHTQLRKLITEGRISEKRLQALCREGQSMLVILTHTSAPTDTLPELVRLVAAGTPVWPTLSLTTDLVIHDRALVPSLNRRGLPQDGFRVFSDGNNMLCVLLVVLARAMATTGAPLLAQLGDEGTARYLAYLTRGIGVTGAAPRTDFDDGRSWQEELGLSRPRGADGLDVHADGVSWLRGIALPAARLTQDPRLVCVISALVATPAVRRLLALYIAYLESDEAPQDAAAAYRAAVALPPPLTGNEPSHSASDVMDPAGSMHALHSAFLALWQVVQDEVLEGTEDEQRRRLETIFVGTQHIFLPLYLQTILEDAVAYPYHDSRPPAPRGSQYTSQALTELMLHITPDYFRMHPIVTARVRATARTSWRDGDGGEDEAVLCDVITFPGLTGIIRRENISMQHRLDPDTPFDPQAGRELRCRVLSMYGSNLDLTPSVTLIANVEPRIQAWRALAEQDPYYDCASEVRALEAYRDELQRARDEERAAAQLQMTENEIRETAQRVFRRVTQSPFFDNRDTARIEPELRHSFRGETYRDPHHHADFWSRIVFCPGKGPDQLYAVFLIHGPGPDGPSSDRTRHLQHTIVWRVLEANKPADPQLFTQVHEELYLGHCHPPGSRPFQSIEDAAEALRSIQNAYNTAALHPHFSMDNHQTVCQHLRDAAAAAVASGQGRGRIEWRICRRPPRHPGDLVLVVCLPGEDPHDHRPGIIVTEPIWLTHEMAIFRRQTYPYSSSRSWLRSIEATFKGARPGRYPGDKDLTPCYMDGEQIITIPTFPTDDLCTRALKELVNAHEPRPEPAAEEDYTHAQAVQTVAEEPETAWGQTGGWDNVVADDWLGAGDTAAAAEPGAAQDDGWGVSAW